MSVALLVAVSVPALLLAVALPCEFGQISTAQIRAQRLADDAARDGMMGWKFQSDQIFPHTPLPTTAQKTARALRFAKHWNQSVVATVTTGVLDGSNHALVATVSLTVPLLLIPSISGQTAFTVTASATAELFGADPTSSSAGADLREIGIVR